MNTDTLTVRMYNVRFGDAILISIPDAENGVSRTRYILIDVGNALSKEGGRDFVFKPVIEDIAATIGDAPVDLYIMTHEHLDHIQGLFYGEVKEGLPRLLVKSAWLPASSEPGYYDRDWLSRGRSHHSNRRYCPGSHHRSLHMVCRRTGDCDW